MKKILIFTCLLSLVASLFLIYKYVSYEEKVHEASKKAFQKLTADAVTEIDVIVSQTITSAETLAKKLSSNTVNKEEISLLLKENIENNPNYYGGAIAFKPFIYAPERKLFAASWYKSSKKKKKGEELWRFLQLDISHDYTKPDSGFDWYINPMRNQKNNWSEPYWSKTSKAYVITYSALFYQTNIDSGKKETAGVVSIDISMEQLKKIIESLDLGTNGFGGLTTREGNYLYHPVNDYVLSHKNLKDIAKEKNDNDRYILAEKAKLGEGGIINHISITTSAESWLIFESVPSSGWSLQNTFIKSDINLDVDLLRQRVIIITLLLIIFFISLLILAFNINSLTDKRVWIIVSLTSLVLFSGIGVIWKVALAFERHEHKNAVKILSSKALSSLMKKYDIQTQEKNLNKPIYIPTGLYIETIKFKKANDMTLTGRIWQTYPHDFPKDLKKEVQISPAVDIKITEINRRNFEEGETIQWYFKSDIRIHIDHSRYPLEADNIWIQILSQDTNRVILVPDLASYKLTTSTLLLGMSKNIFLSGWELTDTFFALEEQDINTNFGVKGSFDQAAFPTLFYQIGMKRIFIDAFISNLTPLIVISIILFLVILLPTAKLDASRILGICVSAFFVVVFSHLAIRKYLSIGEIFYLEYFFLVTYFALLVAPLNSFRVALEIKGTFLEYYDGLILKIAYWPTILSLYILITAWKFY